MPFFFFSPVHLFLTHSRLIRKGQGRLFKESVRGGVGGGAGKRFALFGIDAEEQNGRLVFGQRRTRWNPQ